ncbi:MAG: DUF3482 domain-containing protein [Myxococcota bacterium]
MTEPGSAVPVFAVVGHPNKGKSSLVATLAQDDRVAIAADPGTTTTATRYPMRVDGETLYELVDTPGFQRARGVLAWLHEEADRTGASAADRPALVERFAAEPAHRARFPDEVELLAPIVAGAGILYVVDGSVPYGVEYEAEMEVLRWTGRPSFAVINPIGRADHIDAWRAALGQYFRVVRVFDAVDADFDKRLDLLRAFGELDENFRDALRRAVDVLGADRAARRRRAAIEIASLVSEATALVVEKRIGRDERAEDHRAALETEFRNRLRRLERRARSAVEAVYDFHDLDVEEGEALEDDTERALLAEDLFDRDTWLVFGLRGRDLVTAGAAAGAAAGGSLDAALGGTSFLTGAALGSILGGAIGWWGSDRLGKLEVMRQPLGGARVRYGPARSPNFVAVLLGRALLHAALVARRAHARRDRLGLGTAEAAARAPGEGREPVRLEGRQLKPVLAALQGSGGPDQSKLASEIERLLG